MSRTAICVLIMLVIGGASVGGLVLTDRSVDELTFLIDRTVSAERSGSTEAVESALNELESFWDDRKGVLSLIVQSGAVGEITHGIAKLRELYRNSADDFTAECSGIRAQAMMIRERQIPLCP